MSIFAQSTPTFFLITCFEHDFNMPPKQTGNKGDPVDCLYIENLWCVNSNGTLYVRTVTPALMRASSSSEYRSPCPLHRLGSIGAISFTKSLKTTTANHKFCFKIKTDYVSTQGHQQTKVWGLVEANYSDFTLDKDITTFLDSNNKKWTTHAAITKSLNSAMSKGGLKKQGEWLKKVFKSDVLPQTQHDEITSVRSSPVPPPSDQTFDTNRTPALDFDGTNDEGDKDLLTEEPLSPIIAATPTGTHTYIYIHMYRCTCVCYIVYSLVYTY